MKKKHIERRRLIGAAGALTASLGGGQAAEAAVVVQSVDVDIPADQGTYQVDFNGDAMETNPAEPGFDVGVEFEIIQFGGVVKTGEFDAGVGLIRDESGDFAANLAAGAVIGPGGLTNFFNNDGRRDPLTGQIEDPPAGSGNFTPSGNFQVSDGPGFLGVEFSIGGSAHYGYVGYEGTGAENAAQGRIYGLGYETTSGVAIVAGAGLPAGPQADFDMDDDVDGNDLLLIQRGLGSTADADDFAAFRDEFGQGGATTAIGTIPEPTSLSLLAAGAAGAALYRRRTSLG